MKIITRYLAREVGTAMLVVVLVLLIIFLSHQFVRYMHFAAAGNLSLHGVKLLLLLQLPILSAMLLPVGLFLAIFLAYGRLYADSEMTIFATCGISPLHLLKITISFSVIIVMIVALLSLWINPKVYSYSDRIASGAVSTATLEMIKPNVFTPIAREKWVFYVDTSSANKKQLARVFAAEQLKAGNSGNRAVIMAKNAHQWVDPKTGDLYIILTDGYRYVGTPGKTDYEVMKYDEYAVRTQQEVDDWQADASSASTLQLWLDRHNNLAAAELQWRISLPLSVLVLTLIGVPLSKIRPRFGRYAKLIPAILVYIIYANFLFLAKAWIKSGALIPAIGMWWVHGVMLSFAMFLFWQQHGWKKLFDNGEQD